MNNSLKIECPKCHETIDASTAFEAHYKNIDLENDIRIQKTIRLWQ
jgi:hypothetical protein